MTASRISYNPDIVKLLSDNSSPKNKYELSNNNSTMSGFCQEMVATSHKENPGLVNGLIHGTLSECPAYVAFESLKKPIVAEFAWTLKTTSLVDWRVWLGFVYLVLYSFLPHKALCFIFNAIPILNMVSAVGFAKLYCKISKLVLFLHNKTISSTMIFLRTLSMLTAARSNYPGGEAYMRLHQVAMFPRGGTLRTNR
ncbi:unnamed protein product [Peronospora effusa]|nr:unnamed protein product [Peronospora effusa]